MKNLKLLVLVSDYPDNNGNMALAYVRTRNVYYKSQVNKVDVISFATKKEYEIDEIKVYPKSWFTKHKVVNYDILICHAPNLRNHYLFLRKYSGLFKKIIFFFHGHEVLKINEVYSKPYPFVKQNKFMQTIQNIYDEIKLAVWRKYFQKHNKSSYCIFVSKWMRDEFYKWTKLPSKILHGHEYITYNSVGEVFELNSYNRECEKSYDFITIRGVLDGSKYCVDIINKLAYKNPTLKFLLIGKGNFFKYYDKAPNLTLIQKLMSHQEMCSYMDMAKCALMPTRTDAQGVMMCEMQAYGMPVITSNIPVCQEVFGGIPGVAFIDNSHPDDIKIQSLYQKIKDVAAKNSRYYYSIICTKELDIIEKIYNM